MSIINMSPIEAVVFLTVNNLGRLGVTGGGTNCPLNEKGSPYVVPINYVCAGNYIYSHALAGKLIGSLQTDKRCCLQVDQIEDSYHWKSVIVYGEYEEVDDAQEHEQILAQIFRKIPYLTPVESKATKGVNESIVFKIMIQKITGIEESW